MAFCKYCGKEIPEGQQCTCAESQAANAAQTNTATAATPTAQANIANDCVNDFLGLFVNPTGCLEAMYARASQISGFVWLGINLFLAFILSALLMYNSEYYSKNNFLSGLELALVLCGVKALMAGVSYATKDVEGTFVKAFGTFALASAPSTAFMVIWILPYALKMPGRGTILLLVWASLDMLYGYFAFNTMHKTKPSTGVYVIAQFIACVLFGIFYYYI